MSYSENAYTAILLVVVGYLYFWKNKRNHRYPPGPPWIPLLGNILQLGKDPIRVLQKWAKTYGPIYSIRMGTENAVIVNDPKLLKNLFSNNNSAGRSPNPVTYYFGKGNGIIQSQGQVWEAQRTFAIRKLRDFGVLKSSIEGLLIDETTTLIKFLESKVGTPISGTKLFNGPVVNSLWRIVAGESIDWTSPIKPEILSGVEALIGAVNRTTKSGLFFAPLLRFVAPGYFGWNDWVKSVDNFYAIISKAVQKHVEKLDPNNPRDFIDHYLVEMQKTVDPTSSFYMEAGAKNLQASVGDLFLAGSESNSYTISFAILYLSQNKEVQRKAQKEMDRVVGSSSFVSLLDKSVMPYTEAILLETLRLSSVAALGIPHQMVSDTEFEGYFLPKGVAVLSNLYAIHHDSKIWGEDVNIFRPERFLNENGTEVIQNEALMDFSTGRRICIGESLAKDTFFLFVANILKKFIIEPDPEFPVLDIETPSGLLVEPKPFKFLLRLRNVEERNE